jgi:hypothetical protein
VTLQWTIDANATQKPAGTVVGSANNGFRSFQIVKDDARVLFITGDGFVCTSVYFAH